MTDALVEELVRGAVAPTEGEDPLVRSLLSGSEQIGGEPKTRSQSIGEQLGQPELAEGGMRSLPARALIAAADTKLEKLAAFKKFFPQGDIAFIPLPSAEGRAGDPVLVFRPDPSSPYKEIDQPFLDSFSGGELIGDVVEFFAADLGAMMGEALAVAPQGKLIKVIPALVRIAAGAFGGEIAQEGAERALIGESDEAARDVGVRAAGQGVTALAGGFLLDKLGRPIVNLAKGAGVFGLRTGAQRAMQAAERLGIKPLPATMVSDSPILQRMGRQAAALTTTLNRYVENLENATFRAAQKMRRQVKGDTVSTQAIVNAEAAERADIMRILPSVKGNIQDAGEATKQAIADYELSSQGRVSLLYGQAEALERPKFDLNSAIDEAKKVKLMAEGMGPEGGAVTKLADDIIALVDETGDIPARSVTLSDGTEFVLDATEQIRFLRTRAFDGKQAPMGDIAKAPEKFHGRMFNALSETLDRPVGGSPQFRELYGKANEAARKRFAILDNALVMQAAKTDTPSAIAARLVNFSDAANVENIAAVRRVMPVREFAKVQRAAAAELIRDPFQLSGQLKNARPEALRAMFSPDEIGAFRTAAGRFDALAKTGLPNAIENQTRMGALVGDLVANKNTAGVETLVDIMTRQGGKDAPFGRTLRAGVVDEVVRRSGVFERGVDRIDFKRLRNVIEEVAGTGAMRLLKAEDVQGLNDLLRVQDLLRLTPDAGTSLQAASAVAGLRTMEISALSTIFENLSVGRLVTMPGGVNFLVGKAGRAKAGPSDVIKLTGAIAAQLASDADKIGQATIDTVSALTGAE